jgi:hypothetical protein
MRISIVRSEMRKCSAYSTVSRGVISLEMCELNVKERQAPSTPCMTTKNEMPLAHLLHNVIEGDYRSRDVERGIECVGKIDLKGVRGTRMKHGGALLVCHCVARLQ